MKKKFNVSYKFNDGFQEVYIETTSGREVVRPAVRRWFYNTLNDSGEPTKDGYLFVKGLTWGSGNRFSPSLSTYLFTQEEYEALVADGMPDQFTQVKGYYNT